MHVYNEKKINIFRFGRECFLGGSILWFWKKPCLNQFFIWAYLLYYTKMHVCTCAVSAQNALMSVRYAPDIAFFFAFLGMIERVESRKLLLQYKYMYIYKKHAKIYSTFFFSFLVDEKCEIPYRAYIYIIRLIMADPKISFSVDSKVYNNKCAIFAFRKKKKNFLPLSGDTFEMRDILFGLNFKKRYS